MNIDRLQRFVEAEVRSAVLHVFRNLSHETRDALARRVRDAQDCRDFEAIIAHEVAER